MSRRTPSRWRLAALCLLAALALAASNAQSYYPQQPGYSWTYSNGETQTLSGPREVAGREVMVLTHWFDGVPVSEEHLEFDGGILSYGTAAGGRVMPYRPPLRVYAEAPLEVGDSWQSTTTIEGLEITLSSSVQGVRGVRTPAGRFNALQIRQTTLTSSGGRTVLELFFVPSVGVVRFVTQDGTSIDLIEKSF